MNLIQGTLIQCTLNEVQGTLNLIPMYLVMKKTLKIQFYTNKQIGLCRRAAHKLENTALTMSTFQKVEA